LVEAIRIDEDHLQEAVRQELHGEREEVANGTKNLLALAVDVRQGNQRHTLREVRAAEEILVAGGRVAKILIGLQVLDVGLYQRRVLFDLLVGPVFIGDHLDAAAGKKYHIENNVAFNLQATPFCGVLWTRFVQDVNRRRGVFARRRFLFWRCAGDVLIRKASGLQRGALGAWRWVRRAIAEAGARHGAANSFIAARAVSVSRSPSQRRRTKTIDVAGCVRLTIT